MVLLTNDEVVRTHLVYLFTRAVQVIIIIIIIIIIMIYSIRSTRWLFPY